MLPNNNIDVLYALLSESFVSLLLQASSPACTELEVVMMDWLGKMLKLPDEFLFSSGGNGGGVIQVSIDVPTPNIVICESTLITDIHPAAFG